PGGAARVEADGVARQTVPGEECEIFAEPAPHFSTGNAALVEALPFPAEIVDGSAIEIVTVTLHCCVICENVPLRPLSPILALRLFPRRSSTFAHQLAGARGRRASECLIDHGENRAQRQLIEAAAIAVEMAFATEFLARQARQRILHHPDITAVLDRAGMIPRVGEAADGPR